MAEEKALVKKDIITITKINEKIHYDNPAEVQKIHDAIIQKNMFATSIGQRYVNRLERILAGNNSRKCMFCGTDVTEKTVICSSCLAKIMPAKTPSVQNQEEKQVSEKSKETTKNVAENVKEFWNDPKTQEKKEKVLYNIEGFFYHIKEFWYSLSKIGKVIAIAIFVLVSSVIIGICSNEPGSSDTYSVADTNVSSADNAMEILKTIFPEEEYNLKYQQLLYPAEAMFEGEVGQFCGDSWAPNPTTDAYVFSVQSIEQPHYSCICYVSKDGRIIGYGSLIYEADTSAYFRLR